MPGFPGMSTLDISEADFSALCQSCGACCAYSHEWPRFSLEDDAALAQIPAAFVDDAHGRMRCEGERCSALAGEVGIATSCSVYAVRPDVCRDCLPGDDACRIARQHFGLP
jgi:Fe-S-cluster containining protein